MRRLTLKKKWVLLLVAFCILATGGLVYYYESIPARNWNEKALKEVKLFFRNQPDAFTFAVFGDSQGDLLTVYDHLLEAVNRDSSVCFAIHTGDMVNRGSKWRFRRFLDHTRARIDRPVLTVMGNHDKGQDGRALYNTIFNPPYYSFAIKNCYFIIVDDAFDDSLNEKQMAWLAAELVKAQSYQYRLVFMHIPPFDPRGGNWSHCLSPKKAAPLVRLFKKHGVTHLFTGHIHGYYEGEWEGMHYIISGGAGGKFKENDPRHTFYHYILVSVEDGNKPKITMHKVS